MSKASQRRLAAQQKRDKDRPGPKPKDFLALFAALTGEGVYDGLVTGDLWERIHKTGMKPEAMHKGAEARELFDFMKPFLDVMANSAHLMDEFAPNSGRGGVPAQAHFFTEDWHYIKAFEPSIFKPYMTADESLDMLLDLESDEEVPPYAVVYVFTPELSVDATACYVRTLNGESFSATCYSGKWRLWENGTPVSGMLYMTAIESERWLKTVSTSVLKSALPEIFETPDEPASKILARMPSILSAAIIEFRQPWVDQVEDMADRILGLGDSHQGELDRRVSAKTRRLQAQLEREKQEAESLRTRNQALTNTLNSMGERVRQEQRAQESLEQLLANPDLQRKSAPISTRMRAVFG